jgi:hypothetical protein
MAATIKLTHYQKGVNSRDKSGLELPNARPLRSVLPNDCTNLR